MAPIVVSSHRLRKDHAPLARRAARAITARIALAVPVARVVTALAVLAAVIGAGGCSDVAASDPHGKASAATPAAASGGRFVAHEWGTFITMQGSDGVSLEGLQNEVEKLPRFVHSATRGRESPFSDYGDKSRAIPVRRVRGKGETPVIYFYSERRRRVRVRVDFPGGLLAQWYPQADVRPTLRATPERPLDLSRVTRTTLRWDLELIPARERIAVPDVPADHLWAIARVPRAATVRTVAPFGGKRQAERYVFYRGLGRVSLPLVVTAPGGLAGKLAVVRNRSRARVPHAFLLEMGERDGRFVNIGALGPQQSKPVFLPTGRRAKADVIAALQQALGRALVAEGLYGAEAKAMVRTWSKAWFASRGRRVLYIVPRSESERVWPLAITPRPDELVRVLVGRLEYLTPEDESVIERALRQRLAARSAAQAAMNELGRFGRFLEPALRRAAGRTGADARVKASALELLARYR